MGDVLGGLTAPCFAHYQGKEDFSKSHSVYVCVCVCVCIQSRQILEDSRKVPRLLLGLGLRLIEVGIVIPYEKSIWLVSREYKADLSPDGSEYINFC